MARTVLFNCPIKNSNKFKLESSWFIPNQNFAYSFLKDLTFLKIKANSAKGNKSLFSLSILLLTQIGPRFCIMVINACEICTCYSACFRNSSSCRSCCLDLPSCSFLCSSSSCRGNKILIISFFFQEFKSIASASPALFSAASSWFTSFFSHAPHGLLSDFFSYLFIVLHFLFFSGKAIFFLT